MKEQLDKARVVFGCSGCAAKADREADLKHEEKPHEKKTVRTCTKSGTLPHAVRPATTSVTREGRFTEQWYGLRLKKTDGLSVLDNKKLSQDTLLVMADKEAKAESFPLHDYAQESYVFYDAFGYTELVCKVVAAIEK